MRMMKNTTRLNSVSREVKMRGPKSKAVLLIGNYHSHPSCEAFLNKILKVLSQLARSTTLISGDLPTEFVGRVEWRRTLTAFTRSSASRLPLFGMNQLLVCSVILRSYLRRELNTAVFISPAPLPMLLARMLGAQIIRYQAGSYSKQAFGNPKNIVQRLLVTIFEEVPSMISNRIVIESPNSFFFQNLNDYMSKIMVGGMFVDTDTFYPRVELKNRESRIGYVGVVDKNKGLNNLLSALVLLREFLESRDVRVVIAGDGPLLPFIRDFAQKSELNARVSFPGWIPHNTVPDYLNTLSLLVLPSRSEGLPNIVLEAMASGTPVLSTPVGAVPDLVIDGRSGFIMKNTSPECIASNIKRVLEFGDLEIIAQNARVIVEERHGFINAVKRWKEILEC